MNGIGQIGVLNDVAGSVHRRTNKQSTSQANTRVYYINFSVQAQSASFASPTGNMADSNAETILMLTGISGCTDDEARRWLKVKNSDADAALNAILDNEDLTKAEVSYLFPTAKHISHCSQRMHGVHEHGVVSGEAISKYLYGRTSDLRHSASL